MPLGRKNPAVFSYFGSKRNVANILANKLKDGNPVCEVFAGGGFVSLRLAKWRAVQSLWLNDLDAGTASLWRCLRDKALVKAVVGKVPNIITGTLFDQCLGIVGAANVDVETADSETLVELAWRKAVLQYGSFSSMGTEYIVGRYPERSYIGERLMRGHELLKRVPFVRVTNWDFRRVLAEAGQYTLYVDPPYWGIRKAYRKDFTNADHLDLCAALWDRQNWLLSYDDHESVKSLYAWANVSTIDIQYGHNFFRGRLRVGKELLISPV